MKRFSSSDSLDALVYPPQEKKNNVIYSSEFQAMLDGLDEDDSTEENTQISEKKRRLSYDQVKALERIFAVDNKLEPERKTRLAEELGLQPRQIAIWFQNRRARWKTKQLERDYNLLKANYEALKLNYDKLQQEKEDLIAELRELKSKVGVKNTEENYSVEEKALFLETEHNVSLHSNNFSTGLYGDPKTTNTNHELYNNRNLLEIKGLVDFKDGLSDSDSNGILNLGSLRNDCLQFPDSKAIMKKEYEQQLWNFEEQSLIIPEEPCNIFSVDQAPKLHWYYYAD